MARWIPVEERLPDGNFELLLLNLNGDCLWGWFGEGVFWDHRGKERLVTHWLDPHPLPGEEERDGRSPWVPVEERLPRASIDTLVWMPLADVRGDFRRGEWANGKWYDDWGNIIYPSHWLDPHPLPGEEETE